MNFSHIFAILFRRWILVKRSIKYVVFTLFCTCFFDGLAIFAQYLISTLANENVKPITFSNFKESESQIFIVIDPVVNGSDIVNEYINIIQSLYVNDTGRTPQITYFNNITKMNEYMYDNKLHNIEPHIVDMGFYFSQNSRNNTNQNNLMNNDFNFFNQTLTINNDQMSITNQEDIIISLFYNSTSGFNLDATDSLLTCNVIINRLRYYQNYNNDFTFSTTTLWKRTLDRIFGQIGPVLITGTLVSAIPVYISQPIIDIQGEVRSYMCSCTLSNLSYWIATFLFDFIFWSINAVAAWLILIIFRIQAVLDNVFNTIYTFIMCGPSFIIFIYCSSFMFATADSASRNSFIIICAFLLVPIIVDIVRSAQNPVWLEWLYTFYPPFIIQRSLMSVFQNIGSMKHQLDYYFKDSHHQAYFIMMYGQAAIWSGILSIIELVRKRIHEGSAKKTFGEFTHIFEEARRKHQITEEASEMERRVRESNPNDFAVRIINVSRLFFNTAGKPITAVNHVSLGIEENSIFGFLGANGAGKTTLIKMITSLLPVSDGTIEINGIDIKVFNDPTRLSICPQFNSHLCDEMTPKEHFHLYALLYGFSKSVEKEKTERLIHELDLEKFKDQPIRELSGGDVRKLTIALSFFGPSSIILLDEPTASLDPVARRHVHEIILNYKGTKTIMLCTHLLSEAEFLCDMISIMIKGCVYTCGTPQYLTQKFGTDFRIDILLKDSSPESSSKLDNFMIHNLPTAELSIVRPKARIYSIPAKDHTLPDLFEIMQKGEDGDNGFSYFTCSSSSLERVFMELIHMSENDDIVFAGKKGSNIDMENNNGSAV